MCMRIEAQTLHRLQSSLFHLIVVQRANTPPVAAQISKYPFGAIGSFSECRHSLTSEALSCADDRWGQTQHSKRHSPATLI